MEQEQKYPNCFGCGADNPIGLRLRFRHEGEALITEFTPAGEHEGWRGIVHGGIVSTLLYEVMENFAYHNGAVPMMSEMEVKFLRPARVGRRITAVARLELNVDRNMTVTATLVQGSVVAEGRARLVALTQEQSDRLGITPPP